MLFPNLKNGRINLKIKIEIIKKVHNIKAISTDLNNKKKAEENALFIVRRIAFLKIDKKKEWKKIQEKKRKAE